MEGERLSWELARSSPGAPPRCVCLLRILSFYSLCRVELFTHKRQQKLNWKVFGVIFFPFLCAHLNQEKITIHMISYSPIVHGRYGLLHPGPGIQSLCLQGRAMHVPEHCHPETLETQSMWRWLWCGAICCRMMTDNSITEITLQYCTRCNFWQSPNWTNFSKLFFWWKVSTTD